MKEGVGLTLALLLFRGWFNEIVKTLPKPATPPPGSAAPQQPTAPAGQPAYPPAPQNPGGYGKYIIVIVVQVEIFVYDYFLLRWIIVTLIKKPAHMIKLMINSEALLTFFPVGNVVRAQRILSHGLLYNQ